MTINESLPICYKFKQVTGINPWDHKIVELTVVSGNFHLNIFTLDDAFKEMYSTEYPDSISLEQFLTLKWGKDLVTLITQLF